VPDARSNQLLVPALAAGLGDEHGQPVPLARVGGLKGRRSGARCCRSQQ